MSSAYPAVEEYFHLGKVLKSHSTGGQLRLMTEDHLKSYIVKDSFLFFDLDGSKVPFRVISAEDGAHFVVALDGIDNKQESDKLSGVSIWIPLHLVKSRHQQSPRNLRDKWNEYRIVEEKTNQVYDVVRVEEFPQQLMAVINVDQKEVLVPLSEQLITNIDKKEKTITMIFPEGLLEL